MKNKMSKKWRFTIVFFILIFSFFSVAFAEDVTAITGAKTLQGDINGDGVVRIEDARLAKRIAMKDSTVDYTNADISAGDFDNNGVITINEARKIKRLVLKEIEIEPSTGTLEVHFIDVGQGDAILIKCNGESMLIDAGDNTCGTKVQNYLLKQNVDRLKYVIGTHPGADHIGGLDVIVYKFDCENILLTDKADEKSQSTKSYQELLDTLFAKSQHYSAPQVGDTFNLGGGSFTVLSPSKAYEDSNDASIVLKFTYGNTSFLFTGDATEEAEQDMIASGMNLQADVYKVGHHGSNTSTSAEFLQAIAPKYAVISCGTNNTYGHPTSSTLQKLKENNVSVFRTDEQGTVIAISDGSKITWNNDPSTTWAPGTSDEDDPPTESSSYVLNTSTKKFHIPDCSAVSRMADKNRQDVTWSRQTCIDNGYSPCGICKP